MFGTNGTDEKFLFVPFVPIRIGAGNQPIDGVYGERPEPRIGAVAFRPHVRHPNSPQAINQEPGWNS
jgi:hypothetical protein